MAGLATEQSPALKLGKLLGKSTAIIFIALVILIAIFSYLSPYFLTFSNFMNIIRQMSMIAIVAFGMTYVIIAGEIDLSVGSIIGITGMVAAINIKSGLDPVVVIFFNARFRCFDRFI